MKKLLCMLLVLATCIFCFAACDSDEDDKEKSSGSNVGKYNLVSITGFEYGGISVTASTYEYNYIILNSDGTYKLENKVKANGIVTTQSGKYSISSTGNVTLTESSNGDNFLLYEDETVTCKNGTLTVSAYISEIGNVTMKFEKTAGTGNNNNNTPVSNTGKYNLVSITGFEYGGVSVTASLYEYNYITLNADGTYELKNKVKENGIITTQSGKYSIDSNGNVTLTESSNGDNFLLYEDEILTCKNGTLTASANILGIGNVIMKFEK